MWFVACIRIFLLRKREAYEEIINHDRADFATMTMNIAVIIKPKNLLYVLSLFKNSLVNL